MISIDLGVDIISALVSDLAGRIALKANQDPQNAFSMVDEIINLIESMKFPMDSPYGLVGITIGIHGVTITKYHLHPIIILQVQIWRKA